MGNECKEEDIKKYERVNYTKFARNITKFCM